MKVFREIFSFRLRRLIILLLLIFSTSSNALDTADEFYEDALVHFKRKDFDRAIIQAKNALQLDDAHLPAKILLGESYLGSGEAQAAEVQLRRARDQGADENLVAVPIANTLLTQEKYTELSDYISRKRRSPETDSKLLVILGISYTQQQKYQEAEDAFGKARRLDPQNPEPLLAQASIALNNDDLERVDVLASELRNISPESPDLLLLEGDLFFRLGEHEKALLAYNRILDLNPDYVTGKIRRARILLNKGRIEEVIADLKPLWEEELYEPEAIYLYAMALARSGDTRKANKVLEDASRKIDYLGSSIVDKHPSLALLSATIAYNQGDHLKALESARKLVTKLPNYAPSRMLLGKIHMKLGEYAKVLEVLDPLFYKQENNPQYLALYGRALLKQNEYKKAIPILESAAKLSTDSASLLSDIAVAKIALGQGEAIEPHLQSAINSGNYDGKSGVLLAYTKLSKGDLSGAETTARNLLTQDADNPVFLNLLGTILAAAGNSRSARTQFEKALANDAAFAPAALNLVKFDIRENKLGDAEVRLNKLLEGDPESFEALSGLAQIAEFKGELSDAALLLEKLWVHHPDTVNDILHLIDIYLKLDKEDRAIEVARTLREKHNKNFTVLLALINTQISIGKRSQALDTLNHALRYSVDYSVPELWQLAQKQIQIEDTNGAYGTLSKCLLQNPDYVPAKVELIKLETQLRNYDKALALAGEIIQSLPDSPLGHTLEADILVFADRKKEALDVYNKVIRIWPNTELHLKTTQLELELSQSSSALDNLIDWVKTHPDDNEAKFGLAISYIEVGNYEKSIALHRELLLSIPDDASLHNNLAWLLQNNGDKNALTHARRAHELRPDDASILDTYGWVLSESGEPELGLGYIREALSRSSKDPTARYHLALVLSRLNRNDEAIETLKSLLDSETNFKESAEAKQLLDKLQG